MFVYICIVPSRHVGTLNSRRTTSPLVRLVEGEEKWDAFDHPQGFLPLNWSETESNRTVTYMVLKATAKDKRHLALCHDEFCRPRLAFADQVALVTRLLTFRTRLIPSQNITCTVLLELKKIPPPHWELCESHVVLLFLVTKGR
ncbi:uncharacterized protein TNCV_5126591 [Trichonephila clavipes]|nr:uncharacterized protein TNCV_5126591 [Trichonephila clavipes]